ncbi:MAG TPA: M20/M25/M40 family metallo-hydrolase [Pyrinomonadaceae bacterium]|nr:M20/M25/M40 family metallo-hydrolase [Pyrinomonadaceae bacterium]
MRKQILSLALAVSLFVLPFAAVAQPRTPKPKPISATVLAARGVETINAEQMRAYLSFIASDEMEGRDTPSRGLDTTAKFLALNLSRWGFKPAGDDGTFFQKIALRRDAIDGPKSSAEIDGQKFSFGEDFLPNSVPATLQGPLVFAGSGWVIKSKNLNPYEGVDVKGKIIVVMGQPFPGFPRGVTRADLAGRQGVDWSSPGIYAQQHGAKGVLAIADPQTLQNWEQARARATQGGRLTVEKFTTTQNAPSVSTTTMSMNMATALLKGEKFDAAALVSKFNANEALPTFELSSSKNVKVNITVKNERPMTQNVVAVWEGSDPNLKNEYVALGAHYDHVGVCAPGSADPICNGADDDGSGTTAMLAMAEALARARQRPKRSVLFVWHCGEEKGLWGSRYFAENPTVPLDKIVTQLNMDMIGRSKKDGDTNSRNQTLSGPNTVYVIGSKMMSTELGELSERINATYLNMQLDYKFDDPADPNRFFFRSDHINYARKGIPIIFYFDGVHEDYHRPGDEPQKIDYEKLQRITRTVYVTLWEIAIRPMRPKVDKQLPAGTE